MRLYYILKLALWAATALEYDVGQAADLGKCVVPNLSKMSIINLFYQ